MSRRAIVIAPNSERETRISVKSADYIAAALRGKGIRTEYIRGNRAVNPIVWLSLFRNVAPSAGVMLVYIGHGSDTELLGPRWITRRLKKLKPLSEGYKDGNMLKDVIVYSVACKSGGSFADKVLAQGAAAYIGWETNVFIPPDSDLDDDFISDFTECNLAPVAALYRGDTVAQAVEAYRVVAAQFIAKAPRDSIYAEYMQKNRDGILSKGNGNARWLDPKVV